MVVCRTRDELTKHLGDARGAGKRIGLVPTMGALHEGHLSLIRRSRKQCSFTTVSIYVNPTQFGPAEDLQEYPRAFDEDCAAAEKEGVDLIWAPTDEQMYPDRFSTFVMVEKLTETMCGHSRPGHFRGVATVVAKLFNQVRPDVAYFGQKDAQQFFVIKRMTRDLDFPVQVEMLPVVRDQDGLALSSRNRYFSQPERQQAPCFYRALQEAGRLIEAGERSAETLRRAMIEVINVYNLARIDYVNIVDTEDLANVETLKGEVLLAVAGYIGSTRLIDNEIVQLS